MDTLGILRTIADGELELMRSWRNAPSTREKMYTRHEISVEEHMRWWNKINQRDDRAYFMYELAGIPTGIVGFTNIDRANLNSSWVFYASPDAPKGTGTRMELLALEYAFTNLALHKLHCEVLAFNTPVINLHKKFGFQIEGIFREHHKVENQFVDIYHLGLLAQEWVARSSAMAERVAAVNTR